MPVAPPANSMREPVLRVAGRPRPPVARYDAPPSLALAAEMDEALRAVAALQALGPSVPAGFAGTLAALEGLASARLAGINRPLRLLGEHRLREHRHVYPLRAWLAAEQATAAPRVEMADADLAAFIDRRDLPVLLQAGIVLAQAATLQGRERPDGVGCRALVQAVFARRALATCFVVPVSAAFRRSQRACWQALEAYADGDVEAWLRYFARSTALAATEAVTLADAVAGLHASWREAVGPRRPHAAATKLLAALPGAPVLDVRRAAELAGCSLEGARRALNELAAAGVLSTTTPGKRHTRAWEARALIDLLDGFDGSRPPSARPGAGA